VEWVKIENGSETACFIDAFIPDSLLPDQKA
jgi:hypothetical protein